VLIIFYRLKLVGGWFWLKGWRLINSQWMFEE